MEGNQNTKNLNLILSLLILAVIGGGAYYFKTQWDHYQVVKSDVDAKTQELSKQQKGLEDVRNLLKNYMGVKSELKDLSLSLPSQKDLPNILAQLETLASENKMTMETLDHAVVEAEKKPVAQNKAEAAEKEASILQAARASQIGYRTLKVELVLSGRLDAFLSYLDALQKNLRFFDLVSLDFDLEKAETRSTPAGGETVDIPFAEREFEFEVVLHTYYLQ